jgi:ABC-type cobalamin/Fe3+-siderophores transport system ATPase subunit
MTAAGVSLREVRLSAGGREILSLDALSVSPGEVVAVMGPNGAGKTTLLRVLTGLQRCRAESLAVLGCDVRRLGWGGLARLRRRIGVVPQLPGESGMMPLTLREVVAIGRSGRAGLLRRLGREDWRAVEDWLGRLGLSRLAGQRYEDLSGGEQRRGLIAKAMCQEPELLLLDEPAANLDLAGREAVVDSLQRVLSEADLTVLLVCHQPEVLPPATGRVVVLSGGRIEADGQPGEVLTDARMGGLLGTAVRVRRGGGRWAVLPAAVEDGR